MLIINGLSGENWWKVCNPGENERKIRGKETRQLTRENCLPVRSKLVKTLKCYLDWGFISSKLVFEQVLDTINLRKVRRGWKIYCVGFCPALQEFRFTNFPENAVAVDDHHVGKTRDKLLNCFRFKSILDLTRTVLSFKILSGHLKRCLGITETTLV